MKQLEQSLIGGAVTDSVLNGKLVDLQKENRDLRRSVKKLQEKLDLIVQSLKLVGLYLVWFCYGLIGNTLVKVPCF